MKNMLILLLFGTFYMSQAQDKIKFSYDPLTGNQTVRELCLNCPTPAAKNVKEIQALKEEDLLKFSSEDVISYYPNPVREELYLKWVLTNENFVQSVQVVGINGQLLQSYENKKGNNEQNIPFGKYPGGVYIVSLFYSNGDQKTIKIIKQ